MRSGKPKRTKNIFSENDEVRSLKPISVVTQKEAVRFASSALVRSGIEPSSICSLRDVCQPERFMRALDQLSAQLGGPTRTVENVAIVLTKIARHAGILTSAEIEKVGKLLKKVREKVRLYMRDQEDRDQKLLDLIDAEPKYLNALLALSSRTVRRIVRKGRKTYRDALAIQYALILELWLCTSLRLKNMRCLRLDKHFFQVVLNDVEYVVIRVSAAEVKNATKLEHFLNEDTASLLRLYINEYLPILTKHNPSDYLFPGRSGKPKTSQVFRSQMNKLSEMGPVWISIRMPFGKSQRRSTWMTILPA